MVDISVVTGAATEQQAASTLFAIAFEAASTIEEAAEFGKQFIDVGAYKSKVDYKGLHISAANDLNKVLSAVYASYDIPKLRSVQRMNKRSNLFKDSSAEAAYAWGLNDLYYNADFMKSAKAIEAHKKKATNCWTSYLTATLIRL